METTTFQDFCATLYRRRSVIALTVLCAVGTSTLVSLLLSPVYQATCEIFVAESLPAGPVFSSASGVQQILLPVVAQDRQKSYKGILESDVIERRVSHEVPEKPLAQLSRDVDIVPTRTYTIRIKVRDKVPEIAARAAEAYPKVLNEFMAELSEQRQQKKVEAMRDELDKTQSLLRAAQKKLEGFLSRAAAPDLRSEVANVMARKAAMETELGRARVQLREVASRSEALEERLGRESMTFVSSESAGESDVARRLRGEISDIQADLEAARIDYTDKHPKVRALLGRLEQKKTDLAREVERVLSSEIKASDSLHETLRRQLVDVYVERAGLEAQISALQRALEELSQAAGRLPTEQLREEALRTDVERLRRMVDALTVSYEDTLTQGFVQQDQIVVIQHATRPNRRIFPLPALNAVVAGLLGLIGGVYLALLLEYVSTARSRRAHADLVRRAS